MAFLIIFLISLVGIIILIEYKMWQLRHHKVSLPEDGSPDMSVAAKKVGRKTIIVAKNNVQHALIGLVRGYLKIWITFKKFIETKFPKFYALFSVKHAVERAQEAETSTTSFFWRSVAEYKYKIKNVKHKVYQEIEEKEEMKEAEKVQEEMEQKEELEIKE